MRAQGRIVLLTLDAKAGTDFFFNNFIYSPIYFWPFWVFVAVHALLQLRRVVAISLAEMCGLLVTVASLAVEHGLQGIRVSVAAARGLSSCGSQGLEHRLNSCGIWAQLLYGMWDFPRPGIEPVSPALTGGFFTTELLFESPQDNPVLERWTEIVNTYFTKEDR